MAKITKADKDTTKRKVTKKNLEKALKIARGIKWIWNDEWKGKSTEEISRLLREKAWNSHAS